MCHGRGPGWPDDIRSTQMIGENQFLAAKDLFLSATVCWAAATTRYTRIRYIHIWDNNIRYSHM